MPGEAWYAPFIRDRLKQTTAMQDAGKQVRAMLDSPAWALVEAVLEESIGRLEESIRPPRLPEHVEYAARHGQIEGLRSPRLAAEAVIAVAEAADRKAAEAAGE
jgi:hypothetical protein